MTAIITVHGTGDGDRAAKKGEPIQWWRSDSPFLRRLSQQLVGADDQAPRIEAFTWSGANLESKAKLDGGWVEGRQDAGVRLFRALASRPRGEPYYLVGHSHGGSVIQHALERASRERDELPDLKGVVSIGTPFVDVRSPLSLGWLTTRAFRSGAALFFWLPLLLVLMINADHLPEWFRWGGLNPVLPCLMSIVLTSFFATFLQFLWRRAWRWRVDRFFSRNFSAQSTRLFAETDEAISGLIGLKETKFNFLSERIVGPAGYALAGFSVLIYFGLIVLVLPLFLDDRILRAHEEIEAEKAAGTAETLRKQLIDERNDRIADIDRYNQVVNNYERTLDRVSLRLAERYRDQYEQVLEKYRENQSFRLSSSELLDQVDATLWTEEDLTDALREATKVSIEEATQSFRSAQENVEGARRVRIFFGQLVGDASEAFWRRLARDLDASSFSVGDCQGESLGVNWLSGQRAIEPREIASVLRGCTVFQFSDTGQEVFDRAVDEAKANSVIEERPNVDDRREVLVALKGVLVDQFERMDRGPTLCARGLGDDRRWALSSSDECSREVTTSLFEMNGTAFMNAFLGSQLAAGFTIAVPSEGWPRLFDLSPDIDETLRRFEEAAEMAPGFSIQTQMVCINQALQTLDCSDQNAPDEGSPPSDEFAFQVSFDNRSDEVNRLAISAEIQNLDSIVLEEPSWKERWTIQSNGSVEGAEDGTWSAAHNSGADTILFSSDYALPTIRYFDWDTDESSSASSVDELSKILDPVDTITLPERIDVPSAIGRSNGSESSDTHCSKAGVLVIDIRTCSFYPTLNLLRRTFFLSNVEAGTTESWDSEQLVAIKASEVEDLVNLNISSYFEVVRDDFGYLYRRVFSQAVPGQGYSAYKHEFSVFLTLIFIVPTFLLLVVRIITGVLSPAPLASQLRSVALKSGFGLGSQTLVDVGPIPRQERKRFVGSALPGRLTDQVSDHADRYASETVAKLRGTMTNERISSLLSGDKPGGFLEDDFRHAVLADVNYRALVHSAYFEEPEFGALVSAALIHNASEQALKPSSHFATHRDYQQAISDLALLLGIDKESLLNC